MITTPSALPEIPDVRHVISLSGGYEMPFAQLWTRGPKLLTKGWNLYPIISYRTGFPLDVFFGTQHEPG